MKHIAYTNLLCQEWSSILDNQHSLEKLVQLYPSQKKYR